MSDDDTTPTSPSSPSATDGSPTETSTAGKKRKASSATLPELEVDLSLPEPPSKKAKRALKKGKTTTSSSKRSKKNKYGNADLDDADLLPIDDASPDDCNNKTKDSDDKKKKDKRSQHGVWIGNLAFTVTRPELFRWLIDSSGGSLTEDKITRVNLPTTVAKSTVPLHRAAAAAAAGNPIAPPGKQNKGFAYVDFDSYEAAIAAVALSETELAGRKVLIKDSKSFEGRPAPASQQKQPSGTAGAEGAGGAAVSPAAAASRKIFVGNLGFSTDDDELWAHFAKCGEIDWVKVATFEDSGKCKGYGWVKFRTPEAAEWAVKGFVRIAEEEEEEAEEEDVVELEDNDDDEGKQKKSKTVKPPKQPKKPKTRKWWVNTLKGRPLKIQIAEDDKVRYKKRFGKDRDKEKDKEVGSKQGGRGERKPQQGNSKARAKAGDEDGGAAQEQHAEKTTAPTRYYDDIDVARRTGAVVAPSGKKTTFD